MSCPWQPFDETLSRAIVPWYCPCLGMKVFEGVTPATRFSCSSMPVREVSMNVAIGSNSAKSRGELKGAAQRLRHACRKLNRAQILLTADAGGRRIDRQERRNKWLDSYQAPLRGRQSGMGAERQAATRNGTQAHRQERSLAGGDRACGPSEAPCLLDARSAGGCARQAYRTQTVVREEWLSD